MRDLQQKAITRVTYSKRRLDRLLSTFLLLRMQKHIAYRVKS